MPIRDRLEYMRTLTPRQSLVFPNDATSFTILAADANRVLIRVTIFSPVTGALTQGGIRVSSAWDTNGCPFGIITPTQRMLEINAWDHGMFPALGWSGYNEWGAAASISIMELLDYSQKGR